eukprot:GILK01007175.1.p1 GENE.GILK01007175.1~~GILK01007175.1.p1  ORF type:complete len:237 (-),score=42.27 GILK01007175.1:300-980(-)
MSKYDKDACVRTDEWEKYLDTSQVSKCDLNKLVMNYLVIEGYKEAAEKFKQESGTAPNVDVNSIDDRMAIRAALQRGDVVNAIERVNDLNPEILDTNAELFFHLQQQRLIEFIKEGKIQEALDFAQEELAPRAEENPRFLEELEKTMALLAFDTKADTPLRSLLDNSQRQKTASELNAAILTSQCQDKDPKLPILLKTLLYCQAKLDDEVDFPHIKDIATAELEEL